MHLLGIEPVRDNQSSYLTQESDTMSEWGRVDLQRFLSYRQKVLEVVDPVRIPPGTDPVAAVVELVAEQLEVDDLSREVAGVTVPRDIDSILLRSAAGVVGRELDESERRAFRDTFRQACQDRLSASEES